MNLSAHITAYEDASLGSYLAKLDAHDRYEKAVEDLYQELCETAFPLRAALRGSMSDELDGLLWQAAERRVESLTKTKEED